MVMLASLKLNNLHSNERGLRCAWMCSLPVQRHSEHQEVAEPVASSCVLAVCKPTLCITSYYIGLWNICEHVKMKNVQNKGLLFIYLRCSNKIFLA